jgi:hypothetical protein
MCLYKIIAVVAIFTIACFLSVKILLCFTLIHSFIHHWNYTHNLNNWQHKLVPQLKKAACHQTPLSESLIQSSSSQPTLQSILILSSPPTLSVVPKHFHIAGHLNIMVTVVLFVKQNENCFFTPLSELGTTLLARNMVSYHIGTWLNVQFYIKDWEKNV